MAGPGRAWTGARLGTALLLFVAQAAAQPRASFDDLVASLKSPNARTRQEAAAELGKSRRREAVTPLAALVRDPEPKVRLEVVRALRALRDLDGAPALTTSLQDGDPKIRAEAIGGLVELYAEVDPVNPVGKLLEAFSDDYARTTVAPFTRVDPAVVRALGSSLRDESDEIREAAALALGALEGREATPELTAALADASPRVRGAVAVTLAKLGKPEDGKALIPLLADEDAGVRNRVLFAIGALRVREAGPPLRELFEANRRRESGTRVLECLSRIADPAQEELFKELLTDADLERRRLAIEGLARVAAPALLPAFKKDFQRERNEELRLAYSFALVRLGDRAFVDTIVLSLGSRTLGNRCRSYLLEMGRELLSDLYPYLNDPDADVRAGLCDLLGGIGDAESLARLTGLLSDPSAKVSDRATRAVERLKRAGVGAP